MRSPAAPAATRTIIGWNPCGLGQATRTPDTDEALDDVDILMPDGTHIKKGEHELEQFRRRHHWGLRAWWDRCEPNVAAGVVMWVHTSASWQKNIHLFAPGPELGRKLDVRLINHKADVAVCVLYLASPTRLIAVAAPSNPKDQLAVEDVPARGQPAARRKAARATRRTISTTTTWHLPSHQS
mmetsp:Transcript_6797/g.25524  ORF Transcript_6797/g.25524 Transcript_6797/m.25524 type:complete len:183 (+) Transcript_6797:166-714(+)